jgi:hypothetical protein
MLAHADSRCPVRGQDGLAELMCSSPLERVRHGRMMVTTSSGNVIA